MVHVLYLEYYKLTVYLHIRNDFAVVKQCLVAIHSLMQEKFLFEGRKKEMLT